MAELQPVGSFHGGLHLDDHKSESNTQPIRDAGLPDRLVLPLQQHIGMAAESLVKIGDKSEALVAALARLVQSERTEFAMTAADHLAGKGYPPPRHRKSALEHSDFCRCR